MLKHYGRNLPCTDIIVRVDSGFATQEVYDTCESYQSYYVVHIKANAKLAKLAESFILIGDHHSWEEQESQYYPITYRAKNWSKARRV